MAINVDVTQEPVEVLARNKPNADVTQVPVEVMAHNTPKADVTQVCIQVLVQRPRLPRIYISS